MGLLAIEVNDARILVAQAGRVLGHSPGLALAAHDGLLLGIEARERAFIAPLELYSHFWERLSLSPLHRAAPGATNEADLVHAHLGRLWRDLGPEAEAVLLALPAAYSPAQIELLLGIARELGIPVRGIVDSGLAASTEALTDRGGLHLELHLHRAVLTRLVSREGVLRADAVQVVPGAGLLSCHRAMVTLIGHCFVRRTRFDPLHTGEGEQALHEQLPSLLERLGSSHSAVEVRLELGGQRHATELSPGSLEEALEGFWSTLRGAVAPFLELEPDLPIALGDQFRDLPGLAQGLGTEAGPRVRTLPAGAAALGALRYAEALRSSAEQLALVRQLRPAPTVPVDASEGGDSLRPTHLLFRGIAYPVGHAPLTLGRGEESTGAGIPLPNDAPGLSRRHCTIRITERGMVLEDHSSYGTFLNGRRVRDSAVVSLGDHITLGGAGVELVAIAVETP